MLLETDKSVLGLYALALSRWGRKRVLQVLAEEAAELTEALLRGAHFRAGVCEELADYVLASRQFFTMLKPHHRADARAVASAVSFAAGMTQEERVGAAMCGVVRACMKAMRGAGGPVTVAAALLVAEPHVSDLVGALSDEEHADFVFWRSRKLDRFSRRVESGNEEAA